MNLKNSGIGKNKIFPFSEARGEIESYPKGTRD